MAATILWVHDDFDGPVNGMASYEGKEVWFCRTVLPGVVSSTDIKTPNVIDLKREYKLFDLQPDIAKKLTEIHDEYADLMGYPKRHGDGFSLKKSVTVAVKKFEHGYDPNAINGTYIKTIKEEDFKNYLVAKRLVKN